MPQGYSKQDKDRLEGLPQIYVQCLQRCAGTSAQVPGVQPAIKGKIERCHESGGRGGDCGERY